MKGKKHHKAAGGKLEVDDMKASEGGGDPEVEKEAEEKKHGGKAMKHRRAGGRVDGKEKRHRMDQKVPGRKTGGRAGADRSPLSSAHSTVSSGGGPKEQEGGMSK
jgi:hypothetical protein